MCDPRIIKFKQEEKRKKEEEKQKRRDAARAREEELNRVLIELRIISVFPECFTIIFVFDF
jgi:hypothetical protein